MFDVGALSRLRAAPDQDDQFRAVAAEVDAVAGAVVDPSLDHAPAHGFVIAKVARLHSLQCARDLRGGLMVETLKPLSEWTTPVVPDVFNDFVHCYRNIYVTLRQVAICHRIGSKKD